MSSVIEIHDRLPGCKGLSTCWLINVYVDGDDIKHDRLAVRHEAMRSGARVNLTLSLSPFSSFVLLHILYHFFSF